MALKFSSRANLFFFSLLVLRIFPNPPIIIVTIIGQPTLEFASRRLHWAEIPCRTYRAS